jgi:hypothetical protein
VAERTFFGTVRLAILLAVLVFVALGAWLDRRRSTDWDGTLRVTVYPVAADTDSVTTRFVAGLDDAAFSDLTDFMADEAARYAVGIDEPVSVRVSHAVRELPPAAPTDPGPLRVALWSLKLRYWAWRVAADSTGLQKGLVAVTHLFAGDEASGGNDVVLTHEFLHTLGATDKYDLRNGQPQAPLGLGDPAQNPLYPQQTGEIMAGRIALNSHEAAIPDSLEQMTVGPVTAREIGWLR